MWSSESPAMNIPAINELFVCIPMTPFDTSYQKFCRCNASLKAM